MRHRASAGRVKAARRGFGSAPSECERAVPTEGDGSSGETKEGDDPGLAGLGRIGRAERARWKNFQGNDLGYQGEPCRIDNGMWQILFTIFKQRFGFLNQGFQISNQN
jgi:hypothetical protein